MRDAECGMMKAADAYLGEPNSEFRIPDSAFVF